MAFMLSEDEDLIRRTVREFARSAVTAQRAQEWDRHDRFPEDALGEAARLGLFGMTAPEDAGGSGAGATAMVLALDEVAQVCPSMASVLGVANGAALPLLLAAGGEEGLVAGVAGGEVAAVLATEEASGHDKGSLSTVARGDGEGFRLTGQKVWGLGAAGARHLLVLAVEDGGPAWFHVEAGADGVALGAGEPLLGLRAAGLRSVYFAGAGGRRVGEAGGGLDLYGEVSSWHKVAVAACLNGAVAGALEAAAGFAKERVQFGRPVAEFQAVSDAVTTVDLRLEASRALTLRAAAALGGRGAPVWAARAKEFAAHEAVSLTRRALRVQGGTGFMRESVVQRLARDVRCLQFVAEPSVVQRDVLRRAVLDVGPAA